MNTEITDHVESPAWVSMWLIALVLFAACKWLTWRRACEAGIKPTFTRSLGYLVAWPGMDASAFLWQRPSGPAVQLESLLPLAPTLAPSDGGRGKSPPRLTGLGAVAKTLAGAILLWLAARESWNALVVGWLGMIGLVLFLHFGLFHLLALAWQRAGVSAEPVMRAPLRATSLADFWSTRWNTAFNQLAHDFAFCPMARRIGVKAATLVVFLISGLVHELVISLPARGGFGLPTAYFLCQGAGVLAERSRWGRRIGLRCGWRGWLFVMALAAGPAFFLFPPPFIHNVILPMLRFIGSK